MHGDGKTSRLRITIAYATAGLSGRPRKTCNTGNLNGAKASTSSFPTKLLYYTELDDKTIDNTANRADHPSISFWSFTNASKFVKRIVNLVITY